VPGTIDSSYFIEYDFFIDIDSWGGTGWQNPQFFNNTGPDYRVSLALTNGLLWNAEIFEPYNQTGVNIEYTIHDDTIELTFPTSAIKKPIIFNYMALARKYLVKSPSYELVAFDKSPNLDHGTFPEK
jgi:hypothetical protein